MDILEDFRIYIFSIHSESNKASLMPFLKQVSKKKTGHNSTIYTSSSHKLKDRHSEQCGIHNNSTPGEEPDCIIAAVHVLNYLFSYLIAFFFFHFGAALYKLYIDHNCTHKMSLHLFFSHDQRANMSASFHCSKCQQWNWLLTCNK